MSVWSTRPQTTTAQQFDDATPETTITTTLLVVPNTTTTFAQGTIRSPHEKKGSVAKRTALEFGI